MAYSLGIDLGTTYSAAAVAHGDRLEIFQLGERSATIPSVVVLRADGQVLTGDAADRRALSEPMRTAREFKRRLGDPTPIILGGTPYGAESLMGHLFRSIVDRVQEQRGEAPASIVICHPASYSTYKIDLLRQAIRQADLGDVELLSEPEAAALHYALQERVPSGEVIAVYDFGGGTFDATILRKTDDGFERLGRPEGMERLGGIDFDEAVFQHVMTTVRSSGATIDPSDPATLAAIARLRDECRRAKEGLSVDTDASIPVYLPGVQQEVRLTREEFESMIRPRIRETISALERAIRSAGLTLADVGRTLLVGGTSRIPLVAEMVREATGRPIALDAHPKHTMALGAAWLAEEHRRAGAAGVAGAGSAAGAAGPPPVPDPPAEPLRDDPRPAVSPAAAGTAAAIASPALAGTAPADAPLAGPPRDTTPEAAATGDRGGRRIPAGTLAAGVAAVAALAIAAFLLLPRGPGGTAASPSPVASVPIVGAISPSPSPSPSARPLATPSPAAASTAPPAPTPTPSPTIPPGRQARITNIALDGSTYVVDYSTFAYAPALPGRHVHFFFDTVSQTEAGVPGKGPWFLYAGPKPFRGYGTGDRPAAATQLCVLVANADHSVEQGTGNCVALPS